MTVLVDSQLSDRCPWATCFTFIVYRIVYNPCPGVIYMHITIIVNKFIGIYLRSQVSVYRTIGPLVLHEENKIDFFFI